MKLKPQLKYNYGQSEPTICRPTTTRKPNLSTINHWINNDIAQATDGCRVEPDGYCEHNKPSWLIKLGLI